MPPALWKPESPMLAALEPEAPTLGDVLANDPERETLTVAEVMEELQEILKGVNLGRADLPEEEWPGRPVNVRDVLDSCGDERDWFQGFPLRMRAHVQAVGRFRLARRRRRKLSSGFDFGQIMWIGDMGAAKSVEAAEEAHKWSERGHAVFHNGGFNWGRIIEGADIYEIIDRIPRYSIVIIDEAHTSLESGSAMTSGVRSFAILCAGTPQEGLQTPADERHGPDDCPRGTGDDIGSAAAVQGQGSVGNPRL